MSSKVREYKIATKEDIDEIVRIRSNAVKPLELEANTRDYLTKHLGRDCYVALCEGKGIAMLVLFNYAPNRFSYTGRAGYLQAVYTEPEYRNQGVSTNLIQLIIEKAKELRLDYIELQASDMGVSMYKKLGFEQGAWDTHTYMKKELTK